MSRAALRVCRAILASNNVTRRAETRDFVKSEANQLPESAGVVGALVVRHTDDVTTTPAMTSPMTSRRDIRRGTHTTNRAGCY